MASMRNTLIDAGPIISLFDKSDRYHSAILAFMEGFEGNLITTWPVVTECMYMLRFSQKVQLNFLKWIERGALTLHQVEGSDLYRLMHLVEKYRDVPMDLADASLILVAEKLETDKIITIDGDFYVYRTIRNTYLTNLFTPSV